MLPGMPRGQQGDKIGPGGRVVGGFRRRGAFDLPLAPGLGRLGPALGFGIGDEAGDHRAESGKHADGRADARGTDQRRQHALVFPEIDVVVRRRPRNPRDSPLCGKACPRGSPFEYLGQHEHPQQHRHQLDAVQQPADGEGQTATRHAESGTGK